MVPLPAASPAGDVEHLTPNALIVVPCTTVRAVHCSPRWTSRSGVIGSRAAAPVAVSSVSSNALMRTRRTRGTISVPARGMLRID